MKRKFNVFFIFLLSIIFLFQNTNVFAEENNYYLGGIPSGFVFSEKGVKILSICDVLTENGLACPAKECDLKENDVIISVNNIEINSPKDFSKEVGEKKEIFLVIERDGEIINKKITPLKDINGKIKIGVVLQDEQNGIGTITFFTDKKFASLGHGVYDLERNLINIYTGSVFNAQITGNIKGERGKAGELRGIFFHDKIIGTIEKNTKTGVYGNLDQNFDLSKFKKIEIGKAEIGKAEVYSTVLGFSPIKYAISIIKNDTFFNDEKNLVIRIDDPLLLDKTNGIVQGMSGSPIIQNGKLVGAITHVFINDSTRGYGIKIQDMINNL